MLASSNLGHYELRGELGRGGSGIVYEGYDTRQQRPVAIKILNQSDDDARPLREMRAAVLLDHPGIAQIHEAGEDGGRRFIAMELVPGESLDHLLARGALARSTALDYAIQILRALEAAHAVGVIHRDLKPSNLMVTPGGQIKIVDFGLAKVTGPLSSASGDVTSSLHWQLTSEGSLTGTLAYMAPEQAEGKKADARADLFSFGAVLYELLGGRMAFGRESQVATLVAVMSQDPERLEGVPGLLWTVLERCLAKDPAERWHAAADVRFALELAREGAAPAVASQTKSRRDVLLWSGGVLAAAAAAFFTGQRTNRKPMPSYERLTFASGQILTARLSPDGSSAYVSYRGPGGESFELYETHFGSRTMHALDLPPGYIQAISPQGELAVILTEGGQPKTLARASRDGGPVKALAEGMVFASWAPDGKRALGVRNVGGIWRLEYPIGTVLAEKDEAFGQPFRGAVLSPDGRKAAYFEPNPDGRFEQLCVADVSAPGQPVRVISRGWSKTFPLTWVAKTGELWFAGSKWGGPPRLYAVDGAGVERVLGEAPGEFMLQDVRQTDLTGLGLSHDRKISIWRSTAGKEDAVALGSVSWPDLDGMSADGNTVLATQPVSGGDAGMTIFIYKKSNKAPIRIGDGDRSALSSDGNFVAVNVAPQGGSAPQRLLIVPVGPGETRDVSRPGFRCEFLDWFQNDERLLLTGKEGGDTRRRTFVLSLKDLTFQPVTAPGNWGELISRDGKRLLVNNGAGQRSVHDLESGRTWGIGSTAATGFPLNWHLDGKSIFFAEAGRSLMTSIAISRLDAATGRMTPYRTLRANRGSITHPMITPDGRHCVYLEEEVNSTLYLVHGLA
jgi:serine/threonine protein kinase